MFDTMIKWVMLFLVSYSSRELNASGMTHNKPLDIIIADIPFPVNSTENSGIGYIVCNKTKINELKPNYYQELKDKSKARNCDSFSALQYYIRNVERRNSNLTQSIEDMRNMHRTKETGYKSKIKELENENAMKLTKETQFRVKFEELQNELNLKNTNLSNIQNEILHLKKLLKDETLKEIVIGLNGRQFTNCTICTTVTDNTLSSSCTKSLIINGANLDPSVILIIGISLCVIAVIFIVMSVGYIYRKKSKYKPKEEQKIRNSNISIDVLPINRTFGINSALTSDMIYSSSLNNQSVNNKSEIIVKVDSPAPSERSADKCDTTLNTVDTENTGTYSILIHQEYITFFGLFLISSAMNILIAVFIL